MSKVYIKTGREDGLRWFNDFTIYSGKNKGSRFISFHFPLHRGWCSHIGQEGQGMRIKGGWEYYKPSILTGRLFTNSSKWHHLPTLYVPARLVDLVRLRKKFWRDARRGDKLYQAKLKSKGKEQS